MKRIPYYALFRYGTFADGLGSPSYVVIELEQPGIFRVAQKPEGADESWDNHPTTLRQAQEKLAKLKGEE